MSPAFRKFVSQILTSTRLPSSTILLGLHFLTTRMNKLSTISEHKASSPQVYRMLTIALLLGSKFLDDNTFQNRSWSEVSGLATSELNTLELEWLVAIDWNLHVDPVERNGFMTWIDHWASWKAKAQASKPTALNTSYQAAFQQGRLISPQSSTGSPHSFANLMNAAEVNEDRSVYKSRTEYVQAKALSYSPMSPSDSGPNTPEYYGNSASWHYQSNIPTFPARSGGYSLPQPLAYPHTPYSQYPQNIWNPHGVSCGCTYCARSKDAFSFTTSSSMQSVVA